jgi:hypothetical protein
MHAIMNSRSRHIAFVSCLTAFRPAAADFEEKHWNIDGERRRSVVGGIVAVELLQVPWTATRSPSSCRWTGKITEFH